MNDINVITSDTSPAPWRKSGASDISYDKDLHKKLKDRSKETSKLDYEKFWKELEEYCLQKEIDLETLLNKAGKSVPNKLPTHIDELAEYHKKSNRYTFK